MGSARITAKKKERRKNGSAQRVKPSTPTEAIDARMGEEQKNRKPKKEQKKETGMMDKRDVETQYKASWSAQNIFQINHR